MEIIYDDESLIDYFERIKEFAIVGPGHRSLSTAFLDDAVEIDVDALYDGKELYVGGVMEHIEEAGIHSGDSACTLPPVTLGRDVVQRSVRLLNCSPRELVFEGSSTSSSLRGGCFVCAGSEPQG
jgi:carbamoyl-phosphate synthase large subunit